MVVPPSPRREVSIVVPIHGAYRYVVECLEALVENTSPAHRILLLDDASRDRRIWPLLTKTADRRESILALKSSRRLGFSAAVNLGCRLAAPHDVVLLNSDTRVTSGWLERLVEVLDGDPTIATVTPVSNRAGPFSITTGRPGNRMPPGLSDGEMARLVAECSENRLPEAPTGHGYCMLVARRAFDEVGELDQHSFPDGCGSENDFCMRATRRGYRHVIHDGTFVYHRGQASLGLRKHFYLHRSARRLRRLHPDYGRAVSAWLAANPLASLQDAVLARLGTLGVT